MRLFRILSVPVVFLLVTACSDYSGNYDIHTCYRNNECHNAALACMAHYQLLTGRTDYPMNLCLYMEYACRDYCRKCGNGNYNNCTTDHFKFMDGLTDFSGKKEK
ncbi:MAG TPA: hypothetical protein PK453_13670 [Leptospiraceae bacterium]|nr:hypothetical protein [Leptospiraceae bacterium]HMY66848.1 hypothetical protein [Leptospiraceae bacterium]HNF14713.1 hypothetical protein [Leptospiraceae bacterium]HNF26791.1 hypothetical protein [Leptospiraceae bacterium]HNM05317.1 hypothetical protein [Leptospiraceae bacterium]